MAGQTGGHFNAHFRDAEADDDNEIPSGGLPSLPARKVTLFTIPPCGVGVGQSGRIEIEPADDFGADFQERGSRNF